MSEITERLKVAIADRYVIERELGQGGMATVYLAHDVKHDRKVALKVLRPELAAVIGAERFLQEIKVTANLQHSHILPLYDSGTAEGFLFYVMPYVEGETLRTRLKREKQLGVDDAVALTRAVAAALEHAHKQGVIHRDIKPENILLRDNDPLIADFGIALAVSQAGGSRLTETGLSIGTPHYMSPEQAMGDRAMDARSDVYSLGAMLYEMLAGDPPYTGSTAQAIVAKVITEKAPPVTMLRDTVPEHVSLAIQKALNKLPADRFVSAVEFAEALVRPGHATPSATRVSAAARRSPPERSMVWVLAGALVVVTGVAAWALTRAPELPVVRVAMGLPAEQLPVYGGINLTPPRVAITPDGATIIYTGAGPTAATLPGGGQAFPAGQFNLGVPSQLWIRPLDELSGRPLPGTEAGWAPEVSPDGNRVVFTVFDDNRADIRIAPLDGGPPLTVATGSNFSSASWGPDDDVYFVDPTGLRILRAPASGGIVDTVVTVNAFASGGRLLWPQVLPDGRHAIVTVGIQAQSRLSIHQVHTLDLETGNTTRLVDGVYGRYSPSGHLLYITADNVLMAAPFDAGSGAMTGRPTALIEGVDYRNNGAGDVAISASGSMVYSTPGINAPEIIVTVGPDGSMLPLDPAWVGDLEFEALAVSPDGTRLAVELVSGGSQDALAVGKLSRGDIWIKQMPRGPLSRLTFEGVDNRGSSWSPDGRSIVYLSRNQEGTWAVLRRPADGSGAPEVLPAPPRELHEVVWSTDGRWLLGSIAGPPSDDIVALRLTDTVWSTIVDGPANEFEPARSPDGRWLAYVSEESGQAEIYIRPFPDTRSGKWQISNGGGIEPVWGATSRELFYRSFDGNVVWRAGLLDGPSAADRAVAFAIAGGAYEANPRNRLISRMPGGSRFIMIHQTGLGDVSGDFVFVQNILAVLRARASR